MVRVLRPSFKSSINDRRVYPKLSDYIEVPRLSTYGTYAVVDLISDEQRIALATFTNELEVAERARRRHVRR